MDQPVFYEECLMTFDGGFLAMATPFLPSARDGLCGAILIGNKASLCSHTVGPDACENLSQFQRVASDILAFGILRKYFRLYYDSSVNRMCNWKPNKLISIDHDVLTTFL